MPINKSPLDNITIASPCSADWNAMYGNDRMRFCGDCKLNVYNLSGMSRDEAENLVMNAEGRLCVRFYRRLDGTIITENCPVGWTRVKARAKAYVTAAFSVMMAFLGGLFFVSFFTHQKTEVGTMIVRPHVLTGEVSPYTGNIAMGKPAQFGVMTNVALPQKIHGK